MDTALAITTGIAATTIFSLKKAEATTTRIEHGKRIVSLPSPYDNLIASNASKYGINPKILKAKIYWESDFNPRAISHVGAKGLAQIMDETWKYIWGVILREPIKNPFNPSDSIQAAAAYLKYLLNKFNGDYSLAILAYNLGETTVRRAMIRYGNIKLAIGAFPYETRAYLYGVSSLSKTAVI